MQTSTLFGPADPPQAPPIARHEGPFAAVALEQGIDHSLDYAIPRGLVTQLKVGQRVRVPLGKRNRPAYGYVIEIHPTCDYPTVKPVAGIDDERVLVPAKLMELARWMSRYYVTPLGSVLETILPSAVRKRIGIGYTHQVRLAKDRAETQAILEKTSAPKRRAVLGRLLQLEAGTPIELVRLAGEAGVKTPTIRKLAKTGLISITPEVDLAGLSQDLQTGIGDQPDLALNDDQRKVMDELRPRVQAGGFSVNLVLGVTGSGKTEVYLQCIREAVERGRRAIVLVPEIALTPQTVRRFTARFKSVAILHSGLTATQRHRFWQQISLGHAQVVVGARSAVFAPMPDLGVIVVDEEHESSYKQDTAPRYHGRDIAIKRAQLEDAPVILGSATPSLEMYVRVGGDRRQVGGTGVRSQEPGARRKAEDEVATRGHGAEATPRATPSSILNSPSSSFSPLPVSSSVSLLAPGSWLQSPPTHHLLTLPHRVRGLAMPHVELIDMKQENRFRRGVHLLSQRLEHLLRTTIDAGHQAILLLNRRGYSNFVYCSSCQNAIQCKYCDTTMTYHRSAGAGSHSAALKAGLHTGQLHCHYCLAVNPLPDKCPHCGKLLSLFGLGTQRVEEEITRKFPDLKFARVDSDSMRSAKDYEALLERFAKREVQVMLGTQMIAKGLDYPNVTLVGVISGDTALALPDFRAAERTFQLITQVAGRAGRGDSPGRVVLQTFLPDDPTIGAALRHDFTGFAQSELKSRREVGLPPYARMVRIVLRDEDSVKLHKYSEELAAVLNEAIARDHATTIRIKGPMPCAISRIAGYFRNQIVLLAQTTGPLQRLLADVRKKGGLTKTERVAVDVDPVSLL
ncbi:MAG TPA: primosomal protein N' [Humisphaera sp.]|jgi:primosomal protein N' (replication factor Y)|nr:primosomal protein N' [Humisphaera sp.]